MTAQRGSPLIAQWGLGKYLAAACLTGNGKPVRRDVPRDLVGPAERGNLLAQQVGAIAQVKEVEHGSVASQHLFVRAHELISQHWRGWKVG